MSNIISEKIKELNKKFGDNSVMELSSDPSKFTIECSSTGCLSLDRVLGGGLAAGRIYEIFGEQASGKSTMAIFIAAQVQRNGGRVLYVDAECAFNIDWAKKIGLDTDNLILNQPSTGEEAIEVINEFAKTNEVDLIILDSVASLIPKAELEADLETQGIALQARLMSKGLRILTATLSKSKTCLICINQTRDNVAVMWGSKVTTSGGKALRFYASVRLEVKKGQLLKDANEKAIGNKIKICAVKNKISRPFEEAELEVYYERGIDLASDYFNVYELEGKIVKTGNTYTYEGEKMGIGRDNAVEYFRTNLLNKNVKN